MSRATARVPTRWWTDLQFLALSRDAQHALLLLWTSPETPLVGVSSLSNAALAERLRLTPGKVRSRIVELAEAGFVRVDDAAAQVWLVGYLEAQLGAPPASNPKWAAATAHSLAALAQTPMIDAFRRQYGLTAAPTPPVRRRTRRAVRLIEQQPAAPTPELEFPEPGVAHG